MGFFRRRGHLLLGVLTTTLAVGVNVVVFALINALWLRPQPLHDPAALVVITRSGQTADPSRWTDAGLERLTATALFAGVAGEVVTRESFEDFRPHVVLRPLGREVETIAVTPEYFRVLGVPVIGSDFASWATASSVAVMSHRMWTEQFSGDVSILGRVIAATPEPLTIIGIAPRDFHGALRGQDVDLWLPRSFVARHSDPALTDAAVPMVAYARLRPGMTVLSAQQWFADSPRPHDDLVRVVRISQVFGSPDLPTVVFDEHRFMTLVMLTASGVFLAGCATLMALLLVHYERRRNELAIRAALGASATALARLVLRELLWLSCLATACTITTVHWLLLVLPRFRLPNSVDFSHMDLSADWRVYAVAAGGCVATVVAGAAPALVRLRSQVRTSQLRSNMVSGSRSSLRLRRAVLAVHALIATVLIITAGLFVRSVAHGFSDKIGFDAAHTTFLNVRMRPRGRAASPDELGVEVAAVRALIERLAATPGVTAIALGPPPVGTRLERSLALPQEVRSGASVTITPVGWIPAGPGYLKALGVQRVLGRPGVGYEAVVTSSLARKLWPNGEDAVGQPIQYGPFRGTVVGVVDMVIGSVRLGHQPGIVTFEREDTLADVVRDSREVALTIQSDGPAPVREIEEHARHAFPDARRVRVETAVGLLNLDLGRERMAAWFFGGFGAIALALGLGGVFGLVAYTLSADRRAYGIMMALGAQQRTVAVRAVRTGVEPVAAGALLGAVAAIPLARGVRALLIGIESTDVLTYSMSVLLFVAAAVIAGVCGIRNLSQIKPIDVLRSE